MKIATLLLVLAAPVAAQEARGLELAGRLRFPDQATGDIWVHRQTAYLGGYSCGGPVKVVDVSNPEAPSLIATLDAENVTSEDVTVISVRTPFFEGDLAAVGLQRCRTGGAPAVQFWDVTDPRNPRRLGLLRVGERSIGVHELSMFQRDDRVFALLAVPSSEANGEGGDFRIVEATDPMEPKQLASWGLRTDGVTTPIIKPPDGQHADDDPPVILNRGAFTSSICHSTMPNRDGTMAWLSHWDAGVVFLDISDPSMPRFVGRTKYEDGDEGNAHSVWPSRDGKYLLVADEDFHPSQALLEIEETGESVAAVEGSMTVPMCGLEPVSGEITYLGTACTITSQLANAYGRVALIDAGGCSIASKVALAQAYGARAVVLANTVAGPPAAMNGSRGAIVIPGVAVSMADGERLKQAVRVTIKEDPRRTWGYLRVYDISDPAEPKQVASFATEGARQCPPADARWHTIHNPFVVGDTAYLSWYGDGVRVLDITDPADPKEKAFYIPENSNIWGVFAANGLIYLSDISQGLLILRPVAE